MDCINLLLSCVRSPVRTPLTPEKPLLVPKTSPTAQPIPRTAGVKFLRFSQVIFLVGITASILIPWTLQPHVAPPTTNSTIHYSSFNRQGILQNPPAVDEQAIFELAVQIDDELSGACLQDYDGFLWIGTLGNGLYRYDGKELKQFSNSTGDLTGSTVTALYEDIDGVIWIGTLSGLDTYNKYTGQFASVPIGSEAPGETGVQSLCGDRSGRIWIGTNGGGLFAFDRIRHTAKQFRHIADDPTSIPHDHVSHISLAHHNKLLLATFGGGAARFDLKTEEELRENGVSLAVIVMTAYAETELTVRAIRSGAVTMLEKPFKDRALWEALRAALAEDDACYQSETCKLRIVERIDSLTPAEMDVLKLVIKGEPNKAVAAKLDVSVRTIENRRSAIFEKMDAHSVAASVRSVMIGRPDLG